MSVLTEVFETMMYNQINNFAENQLSTFLTGFRRNHSTQRCLVSMIENWKNTLGKCGFVNAIFINFSKAFYKLNHNLLIAKLLSNHLLKERSSHRRCSVKKSVLRNFAKFTGNNLYQSLFFNKVAGPAT